MMFYKVIVYRIVDFISL